MRRLRLHHRNSVTVLPIHRQTHEAYHDHIRKHGEAPSIRDLCNLLNVSTSTMYARLNVLARAGHECPTRGQKARRMASVPVDVYVFAHKAARALDGKPTTERQRLLKVMNTVLERFEKGE